MRLVTGWCAEASDAGGEGTRKTRGHGWALLCDAVRVVGHDVTVEADPLFLATWLFWCRWRELPGVPDRENLETAIRLFTLTAIVDPADLGAAKNLSAELKEVIDKDALDPGEVLIDEARSLLDILTREFDAADIRLVATLAEAALALAAKGDPRRADYLSNLAAALFAAHRGSGDTEYLWRAVQACRMAAPCPSRLPHLVNLAIGLNVIFDVTDDPSVVEESLGLLGAPLPNDISDTSLRARALSVHSTAREADLPGRVVELLDAGRSILWEQQLNLRGSTGSAFDWPVAEAVHRAARQLRSRYPPLSWAAYLHIGP